MIFGYLVVFIVFSFIGWIIDSTYRSYKNKKLVNAGYLRVFLCPVYGFGALLTISLAHLLQDFSLILKAVIYVFSLTSLEFFASVFCEYVLKNKLWDYSDELINIKGRVSLKHSVFWLVMAVLFDLFVYDHVIIFIGVFDFVPVHFEVFILALFFVLMLYLVLRRYKTNNKDFRFV